MRQAGSNQTRHQDFYLLKRKRGRKKKKSFTRGVPSRTCGKKGAGGQVPWKGGSLLGKRTGTVAELCGRSGKRGEASVLSRGLKSVDESRRASETFMTGVVKRRASSRRRSRRAVLDRTPLIEGSTCPAGKKLKKITSWPQLT